MWPQNRRPREGTERDLKVLCCGLWGWKKVPQPKDASKAALEAGSEKKTDSFLEHPEEVCSAYTLLLAWLNWFWNSDLQNVKRINAFWNHQVCGHLLQRPSCYRARGERWFTINYYRKDSPFLSLEVPSPHAHLLGSKCPPPEERCLSMPETGEKERNCLFKSYTDLE